MNEKTLWEYKSPIEVIHAKVQRKMDDDILKVVTEYGITVNKQELLLALRYDRGQYQKGYDDAIRSITHCANCQLGVRHGETIACTLFETPMMFDDYCSRGLRRDCNDL